MLMMRPPLFCRISSRRAAWHPNQTPVKSTPITRAHSASVLSTAGVRTDWTPALLTMTSSGPNSVTARLTSASTSARRVTSVAAYAARPPACRITSAVGIAPSAGRSRTSPIVTAAPSRARASAMARPSPDVPPVTTATRPASRASRDVSSAICVLEESGVNQRAADAGTLVVRRGRQRRADDRVLQDSLADQGLLHPDPVVPEGRRVDRLAQRIEPVPEGGPGGEVAPPHSVEHRDLGRRRRGPHAEKRAVRAEKVRLV